jgi:hypothetical protein
MESHQRGPLQRPGQEGYAPLDVRSGCSVCAASCQYAPVAGEGNGSDSRIVKHRCCVNLSTKSAKRRLSAIRTNEQNCPVVGKLIAVTATDIFTRSDCTQRPFLRSLFPRSNQFVTRCVRMTENAGPMQQPRMRRPTTIPLNKRICGTFHEHRIWYTPKCNGLFGSTRTLGDFHILHR